MSCSQDRPPIFTRVGHATWGENYFCGFRMIKDLVGREDGFWSAISLAVGGARLTAEQARIIDDMSICSLAADPRIWPMKIIRLIASYGSVGAALAALLVLMNVNESIGSGAMQKAAEFLISLRNDLSVSETFHTKELRTKINALIKQGHRFQGFGVPQRDYDERVSAIFNIVKMRKPFNQQYWGILLKTAKILKEAKGLEINFSGSIAALLLDMDFTLDDIRAVSQVILLPSMIANAFEEAQQKNVQLQRLPLSCIDYQGPPLRLSPRAEQTP